MCLIALFSYVLEKVDLVFLGAEGVVESGGIINKVRNKLTLDIISMCESLILKIV